MGNVFRMHVLGADYGDCLWVDYGDANAPHRILVDAGTPATFSRLKPCLEQVRGATPSHELLLITHIDEDHIGGGLNVLYAPKLAAQFKNIWFNGRRHLLEAAKEEDFGAVQGEKLTAAILARNVFAARQGASVDQRLGQPLIRLVQQANARIRSGTAIKDGR